MNKIIAKQTDMLPPRPLHPPMTVRRYAYRAVTERMGQTVRQTDGSQHGAWHKMQERSSIYTYSRSSTRRNCMQTVSYKIAKRYWLGIERLENEVFLCRLMGR